MSRGERVLEKKKGELGMKKRAYFWKKGKKGE